MKTLYHASPSALPLGGQLRTPTGRSDMDVIRGGVVYLTETPALSRRYGIVHEIQASGAVAYAEQRRHQGLTRKSGRYTRGVWVALPENTRIVRVMEE